MVESQPEKGKEIPQFSGAGKKHRMNFIVLRYFTPILVNHGFNFSKEEEEKKQNLVYLSKWMQTLLNRSLELSGLKGISDQNLIPVMPLLKEFNQSRWLLENLEEKLY